MHITADDLIDVLRSEGLRITNPRRHVCEIIADRHGEHLTAAAIYDIVQGDAGADLDRATVYRTLDVLEEAGVIRHGHIGHGPTVYHLADEGSHQHLVCNTCGRVIAIDDEAVNPAIERIEATTGFRVDIEHFALTGTCRECPRTEA
jgi:Fur family ferric uptake transcriptional regulator